MSPPDINRLLVLPSGCGEQNLVKTATNWVVAEYLVATDQLQDFTAVKIMNNIQRGIQYHYACGCVYICSTETTPYDKYMHNYVHLQLLTI